MVEQVLPLMGKSGQCTMHLGKEEAKGQRIIFISLVDIFLTLP